MLGRGRRSADDKARRAAAKAAKAKEAAEEAAKEAARLAELAAEEQQAADAEAEEDAEDAANGPVEADSDGDASEDPSDADEPAADDSEPDEKPAASRTKVVKLAKAAKADEEPEDERVGTGPGYTVIAVLAVLVAVLGTAATVLYLKDRDQNAVDAARKDATWAASRAAQELSAYDYRTIDADVKTAASLTTGKLRGDYEKQIPAFKAQAVQKQLVGTTTVMKAGVVTATPDKVVVLVYANRSSATKDDKTQRLPEALRLKVTMVEVDGRWLASVMDVIS